MLSGTFRQGHLRLPSEVLIIAMQSHQRYFPLLDADDVLSNRFLFVMNGDPECADGIRAETCVCWRAHGGRRVLIR